MYLFIKYYIKYIQNTGLFADNINPNGLYLWGVEILNFAYIKV